MKPGVPPPLFRVARASDAGAEEEKESNVTLRKERESLIVMYSHISMKWNFYLKIDFKIQTCLFTKHDSLQANLL